MRNTSKILTSETRSVKKKKAEEIPIQIIQGV